MNISRKTAAYLLAASMVLATSAINAGLGDAFLTIARGASTKAFSSAVDHTIASRTGLTWSKPLDTQVESNMAREYRSRGCTSQHYKPDAGYHYSFDWKRLAAHALLATAVFAAAECARAGWDKWRKPHAPAPQPQPVEPSGALRVLQRTTNHVAETLALCGAGALAQYLPQIPYRWQLPTLYNRTIDGIMGLFGGQ